MRSLVLAIALLAAGQAHAVGTIWELNGTIDEVAGPDTAALGGAGVVVDAPFTARFRLSPLTPFTPPDAYVGAITTAGFASGSFIEYVIPIAGGTITIPPAGDDYTMEIGPSFTPTLGVPGFRLSLTGLPPIQTYYTRVPQFGPDTQVLFEMFTGAGAASVRSSSFSIRSFLPEPGVASLLLAVGAVLGLARGYSSSKPS